MPRKTDSKKPGDWLEIAEAELVMLRPSVEAEQFHGLCRARLAEAIEKLLKAELVRVGWPLAKTHDLELLRGELRSRGSDLLPEITPLCLGSKTGPRKSLCSICGRPILPKDGTRRQASFPVQGQRYQSPIGARFAFQATLPLAVTVR